MRKKGKFWKSAALIALSSCLVVGTAATLAGCNGGGGGGGGGSRDTTLSVYIFCNEADKQSNQEVIDKWKASYQEKVGFEFNIDFKTEPDKDAYFKDLTNKYSAGKKNVADIIYLAPKYVRQYAKLGRVMDLTNYLTEEEKTTVGEIWQNAYSFYGYDKSDNNYKFGQAIKYDAANGKYVTENGGSTVGLYGLPKDYSNFSLGYNKQFFSTNLKLAYQETLGSAQRNVANPATADGKVASFTGGSPVATYAASGTHYVYNEDGTVKSQETVTAGQEAPIISIGIPVTYKPFNFYMWNSYDDALMAGDPLATLVETLTGGEGYTVTIPGFPGDIFDVSKASAQTNANNANASYDASIGHITFTYQEYSALTWACTYYLNTFAWEAGNTSVTSGKGGRKVGNDFQTIYGGEQYEYSQGCELYLLPWLAANDADITDQLSTTSLNPDSAKTMADLQDASKKWHNASAYESAGKASEKRTKVNLDGTTREVDVQYGINSQKFMETYAAYENHGAIWNANAGCAKDSTTDASGKTGWDYFRAGRSIFYGAGSWDAATRNDCDPTYFSFGQMPTPVAESYALYTKTNDPDYNYATLVEYSNGATKGTGNGAVADSTQRTTKSEGNKSYTQAEVYTNQLLRQDKWAGRMDSVGYAVNGRLAEVSASGSEGWKAAAAASLVLDLTANKEAQAMLTYSGAQLPNFISQCEDFLYYQKSDKANATFKDMLTPEGFATTTDAAEGKAIWDHYYAVAKAMGDAAQPGSADRSKTVAEFIEAKGFKDYNSNDPIKYNTTYANMKLSDFTGEMGTYYYSGMKILNMVNLTYADRDLNIRMQCGLNGVRDSTMYTPDVTWLNGLDASVNSNIMFTYSTVLTLKDAMKFALVGGGTELAHTPDQAYGKNGETKRTYWSPSMFCAVFSITCDTSLQTFIKDEQSILDMVG